MAKRKRGRPKSDAPRTASGQISRARTPTRAEQEAVMHVALSARARHTGVSEVAILKLPMMGCTAGRMIRLEPDAPELWQAILAIRATRRAYCAAIGMTDEAQLQQALKPNSEFPPDAEPVDPPSYRSEEERHIAAVDAWDNLSARIYAVHPMAVRYILAVVVRDEAMRGEVTLADTLRKAFDIKPRGE
jgi:hypothetical protein